jgi:hypothetical protein
VRFAEPTLRQIVDIEDFESTVMFCRIAKDRRCRIGRPVVYRDNFQRRIVNLFSVANACGSFSASFRAAKMSETLGQSDGAHGA